jgi:Uma2 family endonuclease
VVEPDLFFISNARLEEVLTTKNVRGAPNLVVEIASPSTRTRDETLKRKLYERFGVEEYWVIEPDTDRIVVHRHDGESYRPISELTAEHGDTLATPLLPGLTLPLERIFKD